MIDGGMRILRVKVKTLIAAMVIAASFAMVCAAEEDTQEKGLLSKDSFLSNAIDSVTNKLGKVATGNEKIVSGDAKGIPQDTLEYDANPLGRPLAKPSFRRKKSGDAILN